MAPKDPDYLEIAHQRAIEKKTHVSFPQLKYPSLRDEGLKDPVQWLTGKAMDDGAEGLWRVYDRLYDFEGFMRNHPGGEEWLELTKGTDITELFESHHIRPLAEKMLPTYYVRDAKTPRNSPFTFKEDGFYRTLKRLVRDELEKIQKNTARSSNMLIDGMLITLLVSSALTCWVTNYLYLFVFYLIASVTLSWVVIASHNYLHQKSNWRMYLFNLSLWSYRDFRVSHAISHHPYPNTLMDLEISAFEPFICWNPGPKPSYAHFAILYQLMYFPFLFHHNYIKRFMLNFLRKGFFEKHYRWHDGVGFLLPLWMYLVSVASFVNVFYMWTAIVCGGSFCFFCVGSNAAHHHPKIFKDGDEVSATTLDWGMHEMEAVMDRPGVNESHFKVMISFGHHALHHLFPTLDHAILEHLYPVFLKTCEKFKANFRYASQLELFIGQVKMTMKTRPALLVERYAQ